MDNLFKDQIDFVPVCTCSTIPPTMPTCRDKHLMSCMVFWVQAAYNREKLLNESYKRNALLKKVLQQIGGFCQKNQRTSEFMWIQDIINGVLHD